MKYLARFLFSLGQKFVRSMHDFFFVSFSFLFFLLRPNNFCNSPSLNMTNGKRKNGNWTNRYGIPKLLKEGGEKKR